MNGKQNYPPVSILRNLSKVFEKPIYSQINTYVSDKFSKYLTAFRKNHNTRHKENKIGAIFMDFSNAFDTLNHSLLIAKLEAYAGVPRSTEFNVGDCFG